MKIHIFGTCSGTEPFPGRHHVSFAVDYNNSLYWFDAGECCSYTAHLMGVDIMRTRKIVISHTHMDHIGGLGNLFWTLRKLDNMHHGMHKKSVELYIPNIKAWEGIHSMLSFTEGGFLCDFNIEAKEYGDGCLFNDDGIIVTALHNRHLHREEGEPWRSFGFAIEVGGKKIVYSGDTGGIDDFAPLLDDCDLLLMETGHHHPVEVARELIARDSVPGLLGFIHHGRDILLNYELQNDCLKELLGEKVCILEDATTLEL